MIKSKKLITYLYQRIQDNIRINALGLISPSIKLAISFKYNDDSAYTTLVGKDKDILSIVIGGKMVEKITSIPYSFNTKEEAKPYVVNIVKSMYGLYYHELGHVKYSDMTFKVLFDYIDKIGLKYGNFMKSLMNIIEDPVVENSIHHEVDIKYPTLKKPKIFFNYIINSLFLEQCEKYKDDNTPSSLLNYLLLMVRCGKSSIKGTNIVYEKYSDQLVPRIKKALLEPDSTQRQQKVCELADYIINNITEYSWEDLPEPDDFESLPSGSSAGRSTGTSRSSMTSKDIKDSGTSGEADKGEGDDESSKPKSEENEEESTEGDSGDSIPEPISDDDLDEVFNDLLNYAAGHIMINAKEVFEIKDQYSLEADLEKSLDKFINQTNDLSKYLITFKGRKRPIYTEGHRQGKLDIRSYVRTVARGVPDTHIFKQLEERGKITDLATMLVCDNSGSMSGRKSRIASAAALAVGQSCDLAKIPFECAAFTKDHDSIDGTCVTIIEKSFEDDFNKSKPYFGINDSTLIYNLKPTYYIPTFCGNSEEVNLFYLWKRFQKVKHETKLMIVFCDGATCGSRSNLKEVINQIENDGIYVIGIGIMSDLSDIYPHYRNFNSMSELESDLVPYLLDVLNRFVTKTR